MSSKIPWKKHYLEFDHDNKTFKANVVYWGKDYSIELFEPFKKVLTGPHIMYMIPVKYGINIPPKPGVKVIDLIEACKKKILFEYNN